MKNKCDIFYLKIQEKRHVPRRDDNDLLGL